MKHSVISPCDELKGLVSHFWEATWDVGQLSNQTHYIVANSQLEVTFAFKDFNPVFSSVQGQTSSHNQYIVDGFNHLLGVSIYAHAIPQLFGYSSEELNHEYLSLDTFLSNTDKCLEEEIASAQSTQERISILSGFFLHQLRKNTLQDAVMLNAVQEIRNTSGSMNISDLAEDFCLSGKQFNRRFKAFTGLNPKQYSRIIRFENIVASYPNTSNLAHLAYQHGYYDQAHFNREFKSFTGFNPSEFWKLSES